MKIVLVFCEFGIAALQAWLKSIFEVLGECESILQDWGAIHAGLFQFANALPEVCLVLFPTMTFGLLSNIPSLVKLLRCISNIQEPKKLKMKYTQVYMMSMENYRVQNWNGIVLRNFFHVFCTELGQIDAFNLHTCHSGEILPVNCSFKCIWPAHRTFWGIANGLKSS
jgi:hypothetical protein